MKKFLFTLFILCQITVFAQERITGHVLDSRTGEHIPYVTVYIEGTTVGTATDATGHYTLMNIPVGKHILTASSIGYTSSSKEINIVESTSAIDIAFTLKEDAMALDQVVVSSSRSEVTRQMSPTLVSVMPAKLFETVAAPNLAIGLNYQTGVRVESNCQNCGFTQVRINGLEGSYSQVLIDSRATFSALTGVYGLEQIPANMIDRVEVIRGGGSAMYGSSAIGGVINVITKTPEYSSAEVATDFSVFGKTGFDSNTTANATFVTDNQKAGFTIFGQNRQRSAVDMGDDGYSEIPELENKVLGLRSFFKLSERSKISLQYDAMKDYRRGGNRLDTPIGMLDFMNEEYFVLNNDSDPNNDVVVDDIAEMISHTINSGGISYDYNSKDYKRKLNVYSSMQHNARESVYNGCGQAKDFVVVSGAQFTAKFDKFLFMPAEFIAGLEHNYNSLTDKSFPVYAMDGDTESKELAPGIISQSVNTYSGYVQNEWKNDKLGVLVGVRADKNTLLKNVVFSPRANIRYNPSKKFNFRGTFSTGFRAPQLFDEDLHIALNGGERIVHRLDENLKQERSYSFSLSSDMYQEFGIVATNLLIEGFYTSLQDAFGFDEGRNEFAPDGSAIHYKINTSGAKVYGVALEARVAVPDIVQFQLGVTLQDAKYNETQEWWDNGEGKTEADMEDDFFRSPDNYGYMTATFPVTKKFSIAASGTYTGEMLVPHLGAGPNGIDILEVSNPFFDANLKVDYTFGIARDVRMNINAGILNVFNSYQSDFDNNGGDRDSGYIYGPAMPRRLQLGAKLMF